MTPDRLPALVVVTDLDGTLLDHETYRWDDAREALQALRDRRIPLVLCSSKTRAEMERIARALGFASPLIVENGGAVVVPGAEPPAPEGAAREGQGWILPLGTPRAVLVGALDEMARATRTSPRGFASLTAEEVARLTGLPIDSAALALRRDYDEPFVLENTGDVGPLEAAALQRGLQLTRGSRFFHLMGGITDKGRAVGALLAAYAARGAGRVAIGFGDAPNDVPMLRAVSRPVLIPGAAGVVDPALAAALVGAEVAPAPGPRGWNAAVLAILAGRRVGHA